jgi:hypothetical protein
MKQTNRVAVLEVLRRISLFARIILSLHPTIVPFWWESKTKQDILRALPWSIGIFFDGKSLRARHCRYPAANSIFWNILNRWRHQIRMRSGWLVAWELAHRAVKEISVGLQDDFPLDHREKGALAGRTATSLTDMKGSHTDSTRKFKRQAIIMTSDKTRKEKSYGLFPYNSMLWSNMLEFFHESRAISSDSRLWLHIIVDSRPCSQSRDALDLCLLLVALEKTRKTIVYTWRVSETITILPPAVLLSLIYRTLPLSIVKKKEREYRYVLGHSRTYFSPELNRGRPWSDT